MSYFKIFFLIFSVLISITDACFATLVEENVKNMSNEELVGQLFLIGVPSTRIDEGFKNHIKLMQPGGFILFKRNISTKRQLVHLTKDLQEYSSIASFVAVDQEGGSVVRVPTNPKMPSARFIANNSSLDQTYQLGFSLGKLLRVYGINMNLAPVLDVDRQESTLLKSRSFGSAVTTVSNYGFEFARGLSDSGIIPVGKHFPGLGTIENDPHEEQSFSNSKKDALMSIDVAPFRKLNDIRGSGIMLSHGIYKSIDAENPASLSKKVVTNVLREAEGFRGLVVTDDLLMDGVAMGKNASLAARALSALRAGADILLFAWSPTSQIIAKKAILEAMKTGQIEKSTILEKVNRILSIKKMLTDKNRFPASNGMEEQNFKKAIYNLKKLPGGVN